MTNADVTRLIKRLSALQRPEEAERQETGRALVDATQGNVAHAEAIVDHLVKTTQPTRTGYYNFPRPGEVYAAAQNVPPPQPVQAATSTCGECQGSGWVWWEQRLDVGLGEQHYTGVRQCRCRKVA